MSKPPSDGNIAESCYYETPRTLRLRVPRVDTWAQKGATKAAGPASIFGYRSLCPWRYWLWPQGAPVVECQVTAQAVRDQFYYKRCPQGARTRGVYRNSGRATGPAAVGQLPGSPRGWRPRRTHPLPSWPRNSVARGVPYYRWRKSWRILNIIGWNDLKVSHQSRKGPTTAGHESTRG